MIKYYLFVILLLNVLSIFAQGNSIDYTIDSKVFSAQREISVFVPDDYKESDSIPVIYLFDAQWDQFYNLTISTVDYLLAINEFPKCIVVGIKSVDRQYELTPAPVNEDWKMPQLGGAGVLEKHLEDEIIPFVDSLYHPQPFRIGIGHSLGGTFLLNSLIDRPKLFNAYICISPNLQIDDEEIVLKIERHLNKLKDLNKFIFTSMGTKGSPEDVFLPSLEKLDSIIASYNSDGFIWHFSLQQGLSHGTTPLKTMYQGLLELSKKWRISETTKKSFIKKESSFKSQVLDFYVNLSNWTGYHNSPDLKTFYDLGYFCSKSKEHQEALGIYNWGINVFPNEAMMYYKKGEVLEEIKNLDQAKEFYGTALNKLELQKQTFKSQGDYDYYSKMFKNKIESLANRLNK